MNGTTAAARSCMPDSHNLGLEVHRELSPGPHKDLALHLYHQSGFRLQQVISLVVAPLLPPMCSATFWTQTPSPRYMPVGVRADEDSILQKPPHTVTEDSAAHRGWRGPQPRSLGCA